MALARVIGGPASGITNEEAVEAARFRDDLKIQKCGVSLVLGVLLISGSVHVDFTHLVLDCEGHAICVGSDNPCWGWGLADDWTMV